MSKTEQTKTIEQSKTDAPPAQVVTVENFGGNFTYSKAKKHFGEELADMAFDAVCDASACGSFNKKERQSITIGLPIGESEEDAAMREKINKALARVK
jgi:hypothetical protein